MIEGPTRYEAMVAETAPTAQAAVGFAEPLEREARAAEEASAGVEVAAKRAAESVEVAAEPVAGSVAEDSPAGAVEAAVEETPESVVYGAAEEAPESVAQVAEEAASPGVVEPAAPPCPTEPAVPAPPPSLEGKPPSAPSPLGPGSPVATGQDPQPPTTGRRPGGPSVDRDTREARRSSDPFRDTRVHGTQADALRAQAMRMAVDSPAPREEKPEAAPVERIEASYDHRTGGHDSPAPGSPPEVRERLRFNRFDCAITVRYELTLEGTSVRGEGTLDALNVSVGGLKIRARHKLSVGNQMTLQLPLPDGVIRAKAKVVWTRPKDNEAGIEFVSLTDEDCGRLLTALESDGFPPSPFLD